MNGNVFGNKTREAEKPFALIFDLFLFFRTTLIEIAVYSRMSTI